VAVTLFGSYSTVADAKKTGKTLSTASKKTDGKEAQQRWDGNHWQGNRKKSKKEREKNKRIRMKREIRFGGEREPGFNHVYGDSPNGGPI